MLRVELYKLIIRPRTWLIITVLTGLPVLVGILLKVTGVAPRPGTGPPLLAEVLTNGTLFPVAALGLVLPLFLPVAVAMVGGESIAGEAAGGTLRYLLIRPVSRSYLLVSKLITVSIFVVLAVLVIAGVGFIVGASLFGVHPLSTVSGQAVPAQDARGFSIGVNTGSIRSRRCSNAGGRMRLSPRCAGSSSTENPGPRVASSKRTPFGSRK